MLILRRVAALFVLTIVHVISLTGSEARAKDDAVQGTLRSASGFCVIIGDYDGELTSAAAANLDLLIHRLEPDSGRVIEARNELSDSGQYGRVSVERWQDRLLPYNDNLVNLIVAGDQGHILHSEIMRSLCPNGVAWIRDGDTWQRHTKQRPAGMDEWTHQWHGPDGSLISEDTLVGVPTGLQWLSGPLLPLAGRKSSTQSLVTSGGRNFYITQNVLSNIGRESMPQHLVARDAWNGLVLWSRPWTGPFVTGNGETNSRMVAIDDRVYIAGERNVEVLEASSGNTVAVWTVPHSAQKLLFSDGTLAVETDRELLAFDAATGTQKWSSSFKDTSGTVIYKGRVFCLVPGRASDGRRFHEIVSLDLETGNESWRVSNPDLTESRQTRIAFVRDEYIALQSHGSLHMLSAQDGKHLWTGRTDARPGKDYVDERFVGHFYRHGLVWMRDTSSVSRVQSAPADVGASDTKSESAEFGQRDKVLHWFGLDPATGTVKQKLATSGTWPKTATPGKLGCQLMLATDRFIMVPRQATFVDFQTGARDSFKFARGGCGLGIVPANGLIYVHPHACGCFSESIRGFMAMTSVKLAADPPSDAAERLEHGPAFEAAGNLAKQARGRIRGNSEIGGHSSEVLGLRPQSASGNSGDWPTYRHDARRSGATLQALPTKLKQLWSASVTDESSSADTEWELRIGNRITAPVVTSGKVFVAWPEAHRLVALNAASGQKQWQFTAGGRIDTPPTIHDGLCLFGSHDGWVYCLRVSDGRLVWRHRAAPSIRRIIAFGQLESATPVAGTVLVQNGLAFVAAGRAPDADGGIQVLAMEPHSGKIVWSEIVGDGYIGQSDYLVGDGTHVYLSNRRFDPKTGKSEFVNKDNSWLRGGKAGLLETSWTRMSLALRKGIHDWSYSGTTGHLLSFTDSDIIGFRSTWTAGELFSTGDNKWSVPTQQPLQVEALVAGSNAVAVAGPINRDDNSAGFVRIVAASDGASIDEFRVPSPPVVDGLAAASGRIYVSTRAGTLTCLGN